MKQSSKQKAKSLKLAKPVKAAKIAKANIVEQTKKIKKQLVSIAPAKKTKTISKTKKVKKTREKDISWNTAKVVKKIKKTLHLKGGKKLLSKAQEKELKKLYKSGIATTKELCKKFMISVSTFYKYIKR